MTIVKGSDLISKSAYSLLSISELKTYEAAAKNFAAAFNEQYPGGKVVKAKITQVVLGDRVNLVIESHNDLSTRSFGFNYEVMDRIAENLGAGNTDGFVALVHSTIENLEIELTVKAVMTGDSFSKDGSGVYKCPAMAKWPETREEIILSEDAQEILAAVHREVLASNIANASKNRRRKTSSAKTAPAPVEEAEV